MVCADNMMLANTRRLICSFAAVIAAACLFVAPQCSALSFHVTLDTSDLIGHEAAPFALDFQLNDGSGTDDGNNTVRLYDFDFGGGSASGSPSTSGGASGSLGTFVTITDNSFFNDFQEAFTPGSTLSFCVALSTLLDDGPTPDEFTFAILDKSGFEIPTFGPFNTFILIDIDSANPTINSYASDSGTTPPGGGDGISIAAPGIAINACVPEPSTWALFAFGGAALLIGWLRRTYAAE